MSTKQKKNTYYKCNINGEKAIILKRPWNSQWMKFVPEHNYWEEIVKPTVFENKEKINFINLFKEIYALEKK